MIQCAYQSLLRINFFFFWYYKRLAMECPILSNLSTSKCPVDGSLNWLKKQKTVSGLKQKNYFYKRLKRGLVLWHSTVLAFHPGMLFKTWLIGCISLLIYLGKQYDCFQCGRSGWSPGILAQPQLLQPSAQRTTGWKISLSLCFSNK